MKQLFGQHWVGLAAALALLAIAPLPALACAVVAAGLWLASRRSGQSIAAAALTVPVAVWLIDHPGPVWLALAAGIAAVMFWRYRADFRAEADGK